jgi:hypothetical protein
MEFDEENLKPTFKILWGIPGCVMFPFPFFNHFNVQICLGTLGGQYHGKF